MNHPQRLRIHELRMERGDRMPEGGYIPSRLLRNLARKLNLSESDIESHRIVRESVDARRDLHFKLTVDITLRKHSIAERLRRKGWDPAPPDFEPVHERATMRDFCARSRTHHKARPVVVGFGPAGIFAALQLAYAGLKPIVLEQGADVDRRSRQVADFWAKGVLDPYSNVQFGEGGAGTFSDGKLTTRIKDERISFVLREMVACGAPEEIRYQNKPHIGTDLLSMVVRNLRTRIQELGGEIHFGARVVSIARTETGQLETGHSETGRSLRVGIRRRLCEQWSEIEWMETDALILATGHSGREMFEIVRDLGLPMERKPFAVGFRIEHPQSLIDRSQYGPSYPEITEQIGASDYKLAYTTSKGRSVYSFCMCPGGRVVGAASEHGHLVVNGMSYHARKDPNANSALLVNVEPSDLGDDGMLAGVEFQRRLEKAAYEASLSRIRKGIAGIPYAAPAQRVGPFLRSFSASNLTDLEGESTDFASFRTSFEPGVVECELRNLVPPFVGEALAEALPVFGRKIKGFDDPRALLIGVESRSSSPVRILRDPETLKSKSGLPIYPCGEGAGYAGGITSAAVDGVRAAEAVIRTWIEASIEEVDRR